MLRLQESKGYSPASPENVEGRIMNWLGILRIKMKWESGTELDRFFFFALQIYRMCIVEKKKHASLGEIPKAR